MDEQIQALTQTVTQLTKARTTLQQTIPVTQQGDPAVQTFAALRPQASAPGLDTRTQPECPGRDPTHTTRISTSATTTTTETAAYLPATAFLESSRPRKRPRLGEKSSLLLTAPSCKSPKELLPWMRMHVSRGATRPSPGVLPAPSPPRKTTIRKTTRRRAVAVMRTTQIPKTRGGGSPDRTPSPPWPSPTSSPEDFAEPPLP
ncbi:uncharacterized protein DKFZp434B061-like [Ischnura elegans]|uniref:uncharacterized protein DKFZp434B061-like n=1 Tax=Ischnura elegans TaxID=197161 RepID=UPI001ED8760E|nr:uncharacterized protein DKFZp434B061-like [Ischnura elegans]